MSLSLFIARRIYRESDGGKQVSRPAVLIAMAGIAIGLAVMIIAVAVVIGFKSEVRNKVIGFGSHIQITNLDAASSYETHPIIVGDSMMAALAGYPEISHVQRFSTKPGMIKTDDAFQGMVLKGVGPEFDPRFMEEYLVEGEIPVFSDSVSSNQVLISKALATKMKLKLGDKIYTYYIQDDVRARRLTIAGIYQTNFSEYDNLFLLTDLSLVNRLNGWQPEQVTGVELQVKDYDKLEDTTYEIAIDTDNRQDELGGVYYV
ncbi:ABC transporter permease, partial [Bacteroides congonensis]